MTLRITRRSALAAGLMGLGDALPAALATSSRAASPDGARRVPAYVGVNLAGAEFGEIPGVHGREYLYPTRENVDYYRGLGFNFVRLPFKWERLQPSLGGAFAPAEQALLTEIVAYATGRGLFVALDPHNYARRRLAADRWGKEHLIGTSEVPTDSFADFWKRLAALFRGDSQVFFNLMNEPIGPSAGQWLGIANRAIAAIRGAGTPNLILVPGVAYTGAHSWHASGNTVMAGVRDPLRNFAFDVHQYLDVDSSGTHHEAVSGLIGSERIEAFQDWARRHGFRAVLGEFGGGRDRTTLNALGDLCQEMNANPDVWLGWAAWAGGPRWPEEEFTNLEPWSDGREREQTTVLKAYAVPRATPLWAAEGAAIDLDFARGRAEGVPRFETTLAIHRETDGVADDQAGVTERFAAGTLRRTNLGLLIEEAGRSSFGSHAQDLVRLVGPLLEILQGAAFTLVLTTRALPTAGISCEMISVDGVPLLRRTATGAIETHFGAPQITTAQRVDSWRGKRKVGASVRRGRGAVVIGGTGARCVERSVDVPPIEAAFLGSLSAAALNGRIVRLTAYTDFMSRVELDGLLA